MQEELWWAGENLGDSPPFCTAGILFLTKSQMSSFTRCWSESLLSQRGRERTQLTFIPQKTFSFSILSQMPHKLNAPSFYFLCISLPILLSVLYHHRKATGSSREHIHTCHLILPLLIYFSFSLFSSQQWQPPIQLLKLPPLLPVSVSVLLSSWSLTATAPDVPNT